MLKKGISVFLIFSLVACSAPEQDVSTKTGEEDSSKVVLKNESIDTNNNVPSIKELPNFENEMDFANYIAMSIEKRDYSQWDKITAKEVLFSPYVHIDKEKANHLSVKELNHPTTENQFWGVYDGRGDSILLSTQDYLKRFVYGVKLSGDSVEVEMHQQKPKSRGNQVQNIHKIFPNATFVEFYNPPSTKNGMDWEALIFVVSNDNGRFSLEAIIHNQWTT